jgi:hypothetical protein
VPSSGRSSKNSPRTRPARYPSVHRARTQLREHDDREQFLAGIDRILAGNETVNRAGKDRVRGR